MDALTAVVIIGALIALVVVMVVSIYPERASAWWQSLGGRLRLRR